MNVLQTKALKSVLNVAIQTCIEADYEPHEGLQEAQDLHQLAILLGDRLIIAHCTDLCTEWQAKVDALPPEPKVYTAQIFMCATATVQAASQEEAEKLFMAHKDCTVQLDWGTTAPVKFDTVCGIQEITGIQEEG